MGRPKLDTIDQRIIGALARDGRMSFVKLGKLVGLSSNATTERVRRLERLGVISGYYAHIDPRMLGHPLVALVDVKLTGEGTSTPENFERLAADLPSVRELTFLTGRFDLQLLVTCKDPSDLDELLRRLRADDGVSETETRVVLRGPMRNRRQDRLPQ